MRPHILQSLGHKDREEDELFSGARNGRRNESSSDSLHHARCSQATGELFERLRQPAVAGEILAGVIIGPSLLGWAAPSEITSLLAEIGVIFLLFTVGLETKPASIFKVGKQVAVLGVVAPLLAGWLLMKAWGGTGIEALFVGTAMVATSVGITARVLSGMGLLDAPTAHIISAPRSLTTSLDFWCWRLSQAWPQARSITSRY